MKKLLIVTTALALTASPAYAQLLGGGLGGGLGSTLDINGTISRTTNSIDSSTRGAVNGIHHRFMPVLQGRTPADYLRCADALSSLIDTQEPIGIGSMCRRPIHGEQGLLAVITNLVNNLPSTTRFHLFGVKGAAIPWLKPFGDRIASIDSQAWGITARFDALKSGVSKTDAFAADTLEQWTIAQLSRTRELPRRAKTAVTTEENAAIETDSWRRAIALAQQQFRELIEEGALDHDEITSCWIEQAAADIYHSRQAQP